MTKKIRLIFCLSILLVQSTMSSTVLAETTPTQSESSTLSTVADDPNKTVTERSKETTIASIPESSSSKTEEVPEPESSISKEETKPLTTTLIEGVDIDADFAQLLRTDSSVQYDGEAWSGYGKGKDQLTDDDMASLVWIVVSRKNLTSLKGIEYATDIVRIVCEGIQLTSLDVSQNKKLEILSCGNNQLTSLDISQNRALTHLYFSDNKLTSLDVSQNSELKILNCSYNQLTNLDISKNTALTDLTCGNNQLTSLDGGQSTALTTIDCSYNKLTSLDVSKNTALTDLACGNNQLTSLDFNQNSELKDLDCDYNQLTSLDVSQNTKLIGLRCISNKLTSLDVSKSTALTNLVCINNQLTILNVSQNKALRWLEVSNNQLSNLDVSQNKTLQLLSCSKNQLTNLDVSQNIALTDLGCQNNQLSSFDVSNNTNLTAIYFASNRITDITSFFGLSKLAIFSGENQRITIDVPSVSGNQTTVDILKTSAQSGLSATSSAIIPAPTFSYTGDKVHLSNITRASLNEKSFDFSYDGNQLTEGAASGSKVFSGTINFRSVSDLSNTLIPDKRSAFSGEKVTWTWTIKSLTKKKAENIHAIANLPAGLVIDPSSIEKNGSPATINEINGSTNLGDLTQGNELIFTFKTTVTGNPDSWSEAIGEVDWEDDTPTSPYHEETKGTVRINDDEQSFTPKSNDMGLLSSPISFRFGIGTMSSTAKTIVLHSSNYQTNTNVVTNGFYTRLKDERSVSTGWKLTAQLSDFTDSTSTLMPNGAGTSLRMEDMTIESIINRDTPQEAIDPSPTGVPSTVVTDETLVAGQTAKTLFSAQAGEGIDTWQLRMPFDKISLNLPANAGKRNTNYTATLTWSLDDTP